VAEVPYGYPPDKTGSAFRDSIGRMDAEGMSSARPSSVRSRSLNTAFAPLVSVTSTSPCAPWNTIAMFAG
jgi:hypothetical protein